MTRIFSVIVILSLAACSPGAPEATVDQAVETPAGEAAESGPASNEVVASEAAGSEVPVDASSEPEATAVELLPADDASSIPDQLPAVVAYVNGEAISRDDLEMALGELKARTGQPVPAEQRDSVICGVLDQLINYRLFLRESLLRKVTVAEAAIGARMAEFRAQFPPEEAFAQTLALRQMTLETLRADARQGMQVDAMLVAELAATPVTPEQVTQFYEQNPAEFQQGERVRASHILIGFPQNADAAAKEEARVRAAAVLSQVEAGNDFATLAKQSSEDPGSGANGGDLGYFERGQMVGPFEEVAFSLAPDQASDLVESPFGYHIIRVIDKQAARTIPLTEVRPQVQQFLEGQNRESQTQAFIETLKAKSKVDIYF